MFNRFGRLTVKALVLAVGAGLGGAAIAWATIGSDGQIHGCVDQKGGNLRVVDVDAGQSCDSKKETPLQWSAGGATSGTILVRARANGVQIPAGTHGTIPLTGATWTQAAGEVDQIYSSVTATAGPWPPPCVVFTLISGGVAGSSFGELRSDDQGVQVGSDGPTSLGPWVPTWAYLPEPDAPTVRTVRLNVGYTTFSCSAPMTVDAAIDVVAFR